MKLALTLLALVAYAHAIPIKQDVRTQTSQLDTPTVIVGSSQVDSKTQSEGKVTLHLDQRSQIPEPVVPVASGPKTDQVKQPLPQLVSVVEEPKQEPVLTARNDIVPAKPDQSTRIEPAETLPVKVELVSRNEVAPQTAQLPSQKTPVVRQVVEPQVTEQVVSVPQKPVVVVEEIALPVIPPQPVILVVPPVALPAQIPVIEQDVPQTVVQPLIVPEVPQTIAQPVQVPEVPQAVAVVPILEERSIPVVVQTSPVVPVEIVPSKESVQPELKVESKQGEQHARNLKVDQAPVKAPIVVSAIQKQTQVTEVKSEQQQVVVPISQEPKLEGKNAITTEVKPEPQSVIITPLKEVPKVVLEERRSEVIVKEEPIQVQPVVSDISQTQVVPKVEVPIQQEVKPVRVESVVVPEQTVRQTVPVVIPVQPQETVLRSAEIRDSVQAKPIQVKPSLLDQPIQKESVLIPVVPKVPSIGASEIREPVVVKAIAEPVQVQTVRGETPSVPVEPIRKPVVVVPVVQQSNIRASTIGKEPVKVQELPKVKSQ